MNTVAVISRADEIGGGRVDAMVSARAVATRYRAEPALRGLCQNVVAVAGLLAHTGRTLRQTEFAALSTVAGVAREDLESALLSADRFQHTNLLPLPEDTRRALVDRFGLFGIRLSTALIRQGLTDPAGLAAELVARSGLDDLRRILHIQFAERRDLLKARSALLALDRLLRTDPDDGRGLSGHVERILAGAHEFAELSLLAALRSGAITLPRSLTPEAERLLGDSGNTPAARLGLPPDATPTQLRQAANATLHRWQHHAENPLLPRRATDACRVVVRTCEGILTG